jgi:hypothetical protein
VSGHQYQTWGRHWARVVIFGAMHLVGWLSDGGCKKGVRGAGAASVGGRGDEKRARRDAYHWFITFLTPVGVLNETTHSKMGVSQCD